MVGGYLMRERKASLIKTDGALGAKEIKGPTRGGGAQGSLAHQEQEGEGDLLRNETTKVKSMGGGSALF